MNIIQLRWATNLCETGSWRLWFPLNSHDLLMPEHAGCAVVCEHLDQSQSWRQQMIRFALFLDSLLSQWCTVISKPPSFYNPEYSLISRERQGASIESVAARSAEIRPQQSLQSNEQPQTLYWSQDTRHWPLYTFDIDPIETSVLALYNVHTTCHWTYLVSWWTLVSNSRQQEEPTKLYSS